MNNLVTVCAYDNYITAHIVKARLEAEGIRVALKDENTIIMQWVWSNALGGIKLQVLERDKEKATAILKQIDDEAAAEQDTPGFWEEETEQFASDNRICIHCGSKNTRKEDFNKRPI